MDEDRLGLVLLKTSELRSRIICCIHRASNADKHGKESEDEESEVSPNGKNEEEDEQAEAEAESLFNIKDALESLEGQLSSLQALQQQQWYEKESALAEIEYSQKRLLEELKNYKGNNLEVINEAIAFASITEESNDLLLPPYLNRPYKFTQNGISKDHHPKKLQESEKNQTRSGSWGPLKHVRAFIGSAAKAALTVVGVITILSLAGFVPRLKKRDDDDDEIKLLELLKSEKRISHECPPGKVRVIEDGEVRCVVKERVEIPFQSVDALPDVSYGCG